MSTENEPIRPEHPKPQFQREDWINLNGPWTYCFDSGKSGMHAGRELYRSRGFGDTIKVPFCPESKLSGVQHTDFIEAMWYHRKLAVPAKWRGKRILLHFGAVDYEAEVFIDGTSAGTHYGGTVSFYLDVTRLVRPGGSHDLVVRVADELRTAPQPRGKQCGEFRSRGCFYTRTTGIWQTVWLEAVHPLGLERCQILPDLDRSRFVIVPRYLGVQRGTYLRARIRDGNREVASAESPAVQGTPLSVSVPDPKPWEPGNPFLYDLVLEVVSPDGQVADSIKSYAGFRKIHIEGNRLFLNNHPLYVRFVLDQGFYPDGIWTAPSDEALRRDIELSMKAGFNGARLHQKVFEERFHYWADRLGYLTWGESASWGCNVNRLEGARNFLSEWREIVMRDRNHPSIIAWTPFNETHDVSSPAQHHRLHIDAYELTKALDPTRPVNDASGYIHVRTDLWTVHHYERPDKLANVLSPGTEDGVFHRWPEHEAQYEGQPYINDEFGGIKWIPPSSRPYAENTWGYGADLKSEEEFYALLNAEIDIMLRVKNLSGYCYTQLTDVEQEQNGIYNYDRSEKFNMRSIAEIFRKEPGERNKPDAGEACQRA
ncbi:MAG: glycoside hydrolase family 2 TIM barrel-domain containing protein [Kiritimatiellia bacterium]